MGLLLHSPFHFISETMEEHTGLLPFLIVNMYMDMKKGKMQKSEKFFFFHPQKMKRCFSLSLSLSLYCLVYGSDRSVDRVSTQHKVGVKASILLIKGNRIPLKQNVLHTGSTQQGYYCGDVEQ